MNKTVLFYNNSSKIPISLNKEIIGSYTQERVNCIFKLDFELYAKIEKESLFNLKEETRKSITGGEFKPELDYEIEITLNPEFIHQLIEKAKTEEEAIHYLADLSENEPDSDLLYTENWLALSVKQNQNGKEVGYRTFWSYLSIDALANPDANSEKLTEGLTNFMSELVESNLAEALQEFTKETLGDLSSVFKEITAEEETYLFKNLINFFVEDDWTFTKIEGETSLRLGFNGENGRWNCYAMVREEQQQMAFYSIYPSNIPEERRLAISEFITRVNYGMIIGNFEMDFSDGEIRYKTSIDVEGENLTSTIIKNLVYSNVSMMDEYLPGILAVIEKNVSPAEAIAQIEN
ncbi:MAG: YbjN domain-containing protein [Moorea sp. SIO2B7]|nr:YbjN domain-containing protein [Moorena sp. SIO2B7]